MTTYPVVLLRRASTGYELHREGCRDTRGDSDGENGWDATDFADFVEQAYGPLDDGETLDDYRKAIRVMPCTKLPGDAA